MVTNMTQNTTINQDIIERAQAPKNKIKAILSDALHGMDDGELFIEFTQTESLVFDDGRVKNTSFNTSQGFGLRSVFDENVGFAHANIIDEPTIQRAAETVKSIQRTGNGTQTVPLLTNRHLQPLYPTINPIHEIAFEKKLALLEHIDAYLRQKDKRVKQVSASLFGEMQIVNIIRAEGEDGQDVRPLVRLNISVVVEHDGKMETGASGAGARCGYTEYVTESAWKAQANEALRRALVNLEAKPAPAGDLPVVLGNGWCGVLLHEAVGHGLEGDFNRKGSSTFSGRIGEQVASKGVTVVDDGTIAGRRGSLTIDDEGTPTERTVLIEDGILKGYMQDRMNARLMGVRPTGNGRRESYAHLPLPRMTNTFMLAGNATQEDMIASISRGVYCANFGGGQVDITSGKFVFSASEAYMIENGKITHPIKGATLIGNGAETMQRIQAIGNDLELDSGVGTCGKAGQSVPVGVGQPSLLIESMTVGGTEV